MLNKQRFAQHLALHEEAGTNEEVKTNYTVG
jgi:hypothetical protein